MDNNDFNDLVDSIKQAGKIKTGSMKPVLRYPVHFPQKSTFSGGVGRLVVRG